MIMLIQSQNSESCLLLLLTYKPFHRVIMKFNLPHPRDGLYVLIALAVLFTLMLDSFINHIDGLEDGNIFPG